MRPGSARIRIVTIRNGTSVKTTISDRWNFLSLPLGRQKRKDDALAGPGALGLAMRNSDAAAADTPIVVGGS
jgi:hypothetical protein